MSEKIQDKVKKAVQKQFMDFQTNRKTSQQPLQPSNNRCPLSCWDIFSMNKKNNFCKK